MLTYRNKKTGASFTSVYACAGGDWEEVKAKAEKAKAEKPKSDKTEDGEKE